MGFDQELQPTTTTEKSSERSRDQTGKRTLDADKLSSTTTTETTEVKTDPKDRQARLEALIHQLERNFVRRPGQAKQTAVTLSIEFPERFDATWVLKVYADIDAAVWRKTKVDTVLAAWDDRPGVAKAAIAELRARYRTDQALRRWATAMEKQIDKHQMRLRLEARIRAWDRRPGDAQAAAREANRLWPGQYPKRWLRQFEKQVWTFQDVKWAERISDTELTAALGDNIVDWDEAPIEVKQELQIRLGRKKAEQYYGAGGRGATDDRALVLSETSRTEVLERSAAVTPKGSDFTGFTKPEDIPVKRLDLTAKQYDKKSDELLRQQTPTEQQDGNPLLARQPDVMTTIFNNVIVKQAQAYRERGAAYRTLAANIKAGKTTISAERELIKRDLFAIDNELRNQYPQLRAYEQQAKEDASITPQLEATRKVIQQLEAHEAVLKQVLEDPTGVVPGAGQIAVAMPGPSFAAADPKAAAANREVYGVIDAVAGVTGGENPVGIQKNLQEMAVGLVRFRGRFDMFNAGVLRMVANLGSYVLPDSLTAPILGMAEQSRALGLAFTQANTKFTKDNEAIQMQYTAAGGEIPKIDRIFSTQKIFEKPDVAVLAFIQAMPQTKGASLALQIAITGAQTFEAFFSTYGQTGQLTPAIQAAGWSAVQGAAGIVLDKLGLPPSAALIANITLVYGFGKLRGLSSAQIEDEIAFSLVGAAVGAATASVKPGGSATLEGVAGKTKEIVSALEDAAGKTSKADARPTTELTADDLARGQRIDNAANELATAIESSRAVMKDLQALQQQRRPTQQKVAELKKAAALVDQKRAAMKDALSTPARTGGETTPKSTETDASTLTDGVTAKPTETTVKPTESTMTPKATPDASTESAITPKSTSETTTEVITTAKTEAKPTERTITETVTSETTTKPGDTPFTAPKELPTRAIPEDAKPWIDAEDGRQIFKRSDETFVDHNGRLTDADGTLIDAAGNWIDVYGRRVDGAGRLMDADGNLVDANGRRVDRTGKPIEGGEQAALSEREVIAKLFRQKFGDKVIAYRGIRVPKGTKVVGSYEGGSKHGQMIVFDAESALHYARNPAYDPPGGAAAADEIVVIQFEVAADQIAFDPYGTMEHVFVDTDITQLPGYKESRISRDVVTDANQGSVVAQIKAGKPTLVTAPLSTTGGATTDAATTTGLPMTSRRTRAAASSSLELPPASERPPAMDSEIIAGIARRGEDWANNILEGTCASAAMKNTISAQIAGYEAYVMEFEGLTGAGRALQRFGLADSGVSRMLEKLGVDLRGAHAIAAIRGNDGSWRYLSWGRVETTWETFAREAFGDSYALRGEGTSGKIGEWTTGDHVQWMVAHKWEYPTPKLGKVMRVLGGWRSVGK